MNRAQNTSIQKIQHHQWHEHWPPYLKEKIAKRYFITRFSQKISFWTTGFWNNRFYTRNFTLQEQVAFNRQSDSKITKRLWWYIISQNDFFSKLQSIKQMKVGWQTLIRPVPVTWSACTWVFIAYISFSPKSRIRDRSLSTVLSTGSINWRLKKKKKKLVCEHILKQIKIRMMLL